MVDLKSQRTITLKQQQNCWIGSFAAMASDCEVQIVCEQRSLAEQLVKIAAQETWRINDKYSRYLDNNIVAKINHANGEAVSVDAETAALIDFALHCFQISEGQFDISSGILRKAWRFDGSDRIPEQQTIDRLMPSIGLDKIEWKNPLLHLPPEMEIDFGGIGKEYAVDKVLALLRQQEDVPILINFGGDIATNRKPAENRCWQIGVSALTDESLASSIVELDHGGIATSGDTQRYLFKEGIRYSHILNPKTGWPVTDAPHSVTVIAQSCTDAGILATLAMLQGSAAEVFLQQQGVKFWCQR